MMSASAPDTAGPDCWLELELDYALVEVNHADHADHCDNADHHQYHDHDHDENIQKCASSCDHALISSILLSRNALLTGLGTFCTQQMGKLQLLWQTHQSPMCPGQTLMVRHHHYHLHHSHHNHHHHQHSHRHYHQYNPPVTNVPWSNFDGTSHHLNQNHFQGKPSPIIGNLSCR